MTSIVRELSQSKPFESPGEEAAVSLLRTADMIRRAISTALEDCDITLQQYNVLRILRGAGGPGLPTLEIATRMIEQTPGITRLIDRLEAKKLVERERSSSDRRCVYCRITETGLAILTSLDVPVRAAAESAFQLINERQLTQLVGSLDLLRDGLNQVLRKEEVS